MKRAFPIFILALVLLHFAGFYVYFIVRLNAIHEEARAALKKLPKEELTLITLTQAQFQEARDGDAEIEWQGKMYDIAFQETEGDIVKVYARHDKDEDNLLAFIRKVVNNAQEDRQSAPTALQNFFSLVYVEPSLCTVPNVFDLTTRVTPQNQFLNIDSIELLIDSPPPRA